MSDQLGDREFIERCRGRNVLPTEDIDRLHALAGPVKAWPDNRCDLATLRIDLKVAEIIISDLCASAGLTRADVDVSGMNLAQMTIQQYRQDHENLNAVRSELDEWRDWFGCDSPHDTHVSAGSSDFRTVALGKEQARANLLWHENRRIVTDRDALRFGVNAVNALDSGGCETVDQVQDIMNAAIAAARKKLEKENVS